MDLKRLCVLLLVVAVVVSVKARRRRRYRNKNRKTGSQTNVQQLDFEQTETNSRLVSISAGYAGVWGTNGDDAIFYREGTYGDPLYIGSDWKELDGSLVQVCAGQDIVWGVNAAEQIYWRSGIDYDNPSGVDWNLVEGKLVHVTVSPRGSVWGVNNEQKVYFREGVDCDYPGGRDWQLQDGKLVQVSAGYSGVWGVNEEGKLYYRVGTYGDSGTEGSDWTLVDENKKWKYVSSGNGLVVAVDNGGNLFKRTGMNPLTPTGDEWVRLKGVSSVAVASSVGRDVWLLDKDDQIYHAKAI